MKTKTTEITSLSLLHYVLQRSFNVTDNLPILIWQFVFILVWANFVGLFCTNSAYCGNIVNAGWI